MRLRSRRSRAGRSSCGKRTWSVNRAVRTESGALWSGLEIVVARGCVGALLEWIEVMREVSRSRGCMIACAKSVGSE